MNSSETMLVSKDIRVPEAHTLADQTLGDTFALIDKTTKDIFQADYTSILLQKEGALCRVFASSPIIGRTEVRKKGRTWQVFQQGEPLFVPIKTKRDINPRQFALQIRSLLFIPLRLPQGTIGVLNIFSREPLRISDNDKSILMSIGTLAGVSIQNAQLNEEGREMVKVRDILFAAASHELKIPATTIKLYGQLLEKTIKEGKMPPVERVTVLLKEIDRITKLINQFLFVNRARSGYLVYDFQTHRLREALEYALLEFKANHANPVVFKNLLKGKRDLVRLDLNKLLEAIGNVLDNAAKHSSTSSPIIVSLSYKNGAYNIVIQDKGVGIEKKDLDKIFSAFVKGTSNFKEGIGMGLFITKSIIEGHGGSIRVQSRTNAGTKVTISIPRSYR